MCECMLLCAGAYASIGSKKFRANAFKSWPTSLRASNPAPVLTMVLVFIQKFPHRERICVWCVDTVETQVYECVGPSTLYSVPIGTYNATLKPYEVKGVFFLY